MWMDVIRTGLRWKGQGHASTSLVYMETRSHRLVIFKLTYQ
jgi:hypothetical protein